MCTVFSSVGFFYSAVVTNSVLHTEVPSGTRWDREISVSMHTLHTRSSMIDRKFVSLGKPLEIGEHGGPICFSPVWDAVCDRSSVGRHSPP